MRRALVVHESMFGHTAQVARAVAAGVGEVMAVEVVPVEKAPHTLAGYDLVLAGGPTHAFSMSREASRTEARGRGALHGRVAFGLREWLSCLGADEHVAAATFDTRVATVRHLPGSAARAAARVARRHGLREVARPESFYVADVEGPLLDGELDRARVWGRSIAVTRMQVAPAT